MSRQVIIKIAVGVSAVASLFSLVTLIRAFIIGSNVVFPIVQVIGSAAIFTICLLMLRTLSAGEAEDEADEAGSETEAATTETHDSEEQAEKEIDDLYEKYHLMDFEEKDQ